MSVENITFEKMPDSSSGILHTSPKVLSDPPKISISLMPDEVDSVVHAVISNYTNRTNAGIDKYGFPFDRSDMSVIKWMHNAQEELMENILYIEKIKQLYIHKTRALAVFLEEQHARAEAMKKNASESNG
jgi:hypothetical protein